MMSHDDSLSRFVALQGHTVRNSEGSGQGVHTDTGEKCSQATPDTSAVTQLSQPGDEMTANEPTLDVE